MGHGAVHECLARGRSERRAAPTVQIHKPSSVELMVTPSGFRNLDGWNQGLGLSGPLGSELPRAGEPHRPWSERGGVVQSTHIVALVPLQQCGLRIEQVADKD